MSVAKKRSRAQRAALKGLVMIFGDRALLQIGYPGRIAKWLGCPPPLVRPHPYTLYELNPAWRSGDGKSMHNSLGFRGAEIVVPKPEDRFRVVCMGESSTYCTGIDDDRDTYPYRLGEHLRSMLADTDIEVINAGVGGYTSIENILRLLFHVVPLRPDLIVYYYTHNDVHPRRLANLSRDYREYSCSWFEPAMGGGFYGWFKRRQNLATAYVGNVVRRRGGGRRNSKHIAGNPPVAFRANLTSLVVLAKTAGARVLLVNPNYRQESAQDPMPGAVWEHRRVVDDIGKALEVPVVDLHGALAYPEEGAIIMNENYKDEVHFSEKGADAAARIIAGAIVDSGLHDSTKGGTPLIF